MNRSVEVKDCSGCGKHHINVHPQLLDIPRFIGNERWTHYYICQESMQPVYVRETVTTA